jgi:ribonuclease P protein component
LPTNRGKAVPDVQVALSTDSGNEAFGTSAGSPTESPRYTPDKPPSPIGRLKRRSEFLRVAALRCKWATPGLILQAAPAAASPPTAPSSDAHGLPALGSVMPAALRVGFTCSKKVGNAVARNRAKRRLRAAAAAILPVHAVPGYDYVLIGRQETLRRPYALLLQDLQTALKRVCANHNGNRADRPSQTRQSGQEGS